MFGSRLPVIFNPQDKYFIDLFKTGRGDVDWEVSSSHPWIQISKSSGTLKDEFLKKEERIWIGIDRDKINSENQNKDL